MARSHVDATKLHPSEDWLGLFDFDNLAGLEINKDGQLVGKNVCCQLDRAFAIHGAVGFNVKNQLVQIGALLEVMADADGVIAFRVAMTDHRDGRVRFEYRTRVYLGRPAT